MLFITHLNTPSQKCTSVQEDVTPATRNCVRNVDRQHRQVIDVVSTEASDLVARAPVQAAGLVQSHRSVHMQRMDAHVEYYLCPRSQVSDLNVQNDAILSDTNWYRVPDRLKVNTHLVQLRRQLLASNLRVC